jgi:transcriptional regulator with XRE-family HTH domain
MGERILKMGKPWVLGARLLAARQLADLSQKDTAEKLGISATAVGKYESGDTEPTIAALILISRIYGENLALFLKELEPDPTDDFALDKEAVRIGYRLRHLRGRRPRAWIAHKLGIKREEIRQYELGEVRQPA